jgi:hypothetical protein
MSYGCRYFISGLCVVKHSAGQEARGATFVAGQDRLDGGKPKQSYQQQQHHHVQPPLDSEHFLSPPIGEHQDPSTYPFYNIRRYRPYFDVDTNVSKGCTIAQFIRQELSSRAGVRKPCPSLQARKVCRP